MAIIRGTDGADILSGTSGDDTIDGLAGNDIINEITGGNDLLRGGLGNDTFNITRYYSNSAVAKVSADGGDGDDIFNAQIYGQDTADLTGGAGNDTFNILGASALTVDGGSGDDLFNIGSPSNISYLTGTLTLGSGRDGIVLGTRYSSIIVTDFSSSSGDYLSLETAVASAASGWDQASNPFQAGYAKLVQSGLDLLVQIDADGSSGSYGAQTVMTLQGVSARALTAASLGGYLADGSAPADMVVPAGTKTGVFFGGTGSDTLNGSDFADAISGGAGNDTIFGGAGADVIDGGLGSDSLHGGIGDDIITDSWGTSNELFGDDGNDTLTWTGQYIYGVGATTPSAPLVVLDGGNGNDTITASGPGIVTIYGGAGNDTITMNQGGRIDAGSGDDIVIVPTYVSDATNIRLGSGADIITFANFFPSSSNSTVIVEDFSAGAGGDMIDLTNILSNGFTNWNGSTNPFASGHLQLVASGSDVILTIDADSTGMGYSSGNLMRFANTTLANFAAANFGGYSPNGAAPTALQITGTSAADTINGSLGNDILNGLDGNDVINGGYGSDQIDGGAGDDILSGGRGADVVHGGVGNDTLTEIFSNQSESLFGDNGADRIELLAPSTMNFSGQASASVILDGGAGNDEIFVFADIDGPYSFYSAWQQLDINGGAGDDLIRLGVVSNVRIDAGAGADTLTFTSINGFTDAMVAYLGQGQDTVVFNRGTNKLSIADFQVGEAGDRLDFSAVTGPITLSQVGSNVTLSTSNNATITLQGVKISDLSAFNLGFANASFAPNDYTFTGSALGEELVGGDGRDILYGVEGNDILRGGAGADIINGGDGDDLLVGGSGSDAIDGGAGFDVISFESARGAVNIDLTDKTISGAGYDGDTFINVEGVRGTAFNDTLRGTIGNDRLEGGAGNDVFLGRGGSDVIDGGSGYDRATIDGFFRQGSVPVSLAYSAVGGSIVQNVESVQLLDGRLVFDADSVGAQVTRLYDTVLQRGADPVGLDYWLDQIQDNGATLNTVAASFLNSPEFQAATGTLSNMAFVEYVYQQALGRGADAGGSSYWTSQLDGGLPRSSMLIGFSESAEHRALTDDLVGKGYFDTDDTYQAVALLYDSFTGRLPDTGGLTFWSEQVKAGARTLTQVANEFAASGEFTNAIAGKDNGQLVDFMYQNTLDRSPDASGRAFWVSQLDAGLTKGALLLSFSQSAEHYVLKAADIIGGIKVAGSASGTAAFSPVQGDNMHDGASLSSPAPASAFILENAEATSLDVAQTMWLNPSHYADASIPAYSDMAHVL